MVQATNFLLRWLFLCRLVDDRAEVQTWPYRRPGYYEHPPPHPHQPQPPPSSQQQQHYQCQQGEDLPLPQQQQQHPQHPYPPQAQQPHPRHPHNTVESHHPPPQDHDPPPPLEHDVHDDADNMDIPTYRESIIQSLTSYPPGSTERLQRLEELRLQTVHEFARRLVHADGVIRWAQAGDDEGGGDGGGVVNEKEERGIRGDEAASATTSAVNNGDGGFDDADASIHEDLKLFLQREQQHQDTHQQSNIWKHGWDLLRGRHEEGQGEDAADEGHHSAAAADTHNPLRHQTPDQVQTSLATAYRLLAETRQFLPQLVSTVLHSPPPLLPGAPPSHHRRPDGHRDRDPIAALRALLLRRCRTTPSLGLELCWLLEAEVGREWKALFEHRQRTGRRLVLVVREDIAAAIASVGAEKASAFNLLQDAEVATAFGTARRHEDPGAGAGPGFGPGSVPAAVDWEAAAAPSSSGPPPRAISDLRCRHYGDAMHFVDRLTQVSLDLRRVPQGVHRQTALGARLTELNRRLCRRMVTRGRISIDAEDAALGGGGPGAPPYQQPPPPWSEENVREDMISHSVHFPFEPQSVVWPGDAAVPASSRRPASVPSNRERPPRHNGVVRALRILPASCRVLDSASRCPFLVRMEVAETGLDADDARLYAGAAPEVGGGGGGVGVTLQEALGSVRGQGGAFGEGFAPCEIPPELMHGPRRRRGASAAPDGGIEAGPEERGDATILHGHSSSAARRDHAPVTPYYDNSHATSTSSMDNKAVLSRGGQVGEEGYYEPTPPFDLVREQHYEALHQELRHRRENEFMSPSPPVAAAGSNQLATGRTLLDNVFGEPWHVQCQAIRAQSPYRDVAGWKLASFIVKAGEDIRKEALVMQITAKLWTWFREEIPPRLRPFLRPYTILCVGGEAGIVECLPDVKSIDEVKKAADGFTSLKDFFARAFGPAPWGPDAALPAGGAVSLEKARDNFLRSLVGYSVVCYILQIKDRHNANILMDREGHIMHIDFGFVLGETPKMGKVPLFSERAPFKLSAEFWEVIGGWSAFKRFCEMFEAAYAVASAHSDEICSLIEAAIMNVSRNADVARSMANDVRGRIMMKGNPKEQKLHIMNIVNDAITSWGTSTYDWLQRSMHGYQ